MNVLTLPELAVRECVRVDELRKAAVKLAAAGLLKKFGAYWIADAKDVPAILEALKRPKVV